VYSILEYTFSLCLLCFCSERFLLPIWELRFLMVRFNIAPRRNGKNYRRFGGTCCHPPDSYLTPKKMKKKAVRSFETSVIFVISIRCVTWSFWNQFIIPDAVYWALWTSCMCCTYLDLLLIERPAVITDKNRPPLVGILARSSLQEWAATCIVKTVAHERFYKPFVNFF